MESSQLQWKWKYYGGWVFFCHFFPRILVKYIFLVSTSFCVGEFGRRWFWLLVWKNGLWRGYNFSRFWEAKIKQRQSDKFCIYSVKKYPTKRSKVRVPNGQHVLFAVLAHFGCTFFSIWGFLSCVVHENDIFRVNTSSFHYICFSLNKTTL